MEKKLETTIVKELRNEVGALAIIIKSVLEECIIYRGIVLHKNSIQITHDASTEDEIMYECTCRLRDLIQ